MFNMLFFYTVLLMIIISNANYTECGYKDPEDGTIWDLSGLVYNYGDNFYTLPQNADPFKGNITFYIMFCVNISAIPSGGICGQSASQVCNATNENGTECIQFATRPSNSKTYGYVAYPDGSCFAIAGGDEESFIDQNKLIEYSSHGPMGQKQLSIHYNYGDYCNKTGSAVNRVLTIEMECDKSIGSEIELGTQIIASSVDSCGSILNIRSKYGCPVVNGTTTTTTTTTTTVTTTDEAIMTSDFDMNDTIDTTEEEETTTVYKYSIYGEWGMYDFEENMIFGIKVGVNTDCSEIKFILVSPANDTWFGVGFGGDYEEDIDIDASSGDEHESHEHEDEEMNVMNGYAIIVMDVDDVYESILEPGIAPKRQQDIGATEDLNCDGMEIDGVRQIVCIRAYDTNDVNADDFYEFFVGKNPMIYAYGAIDDNGLPQQHHANPKEYGKADEHFIYMEEIGDLCGFAKQYPTDIESGTNKEQQMWMILGVIFIILFAITCGVVIFLIWKLKSKDEHTGNVQPGGYTQTGHDDD